MNKDKNHAAPITVPANLGAKSNTIEPKIIIPIEMSIGCFT